jgi:RNA polymerase sigma factor (sigma-70 family)
MNPSLRAWPPIADLPAAMRPSPQREPASRPPKTVARAARAPASDAKVASIPTRTAQHLQQEETLRTLLADIAKRDQSALSKLYDATVGKVYGVALRITRQAELAEEVTADVYLQAWRTAGNYEAARGHPLAWLTVIARSRALDALRARDTAVAHAEPETLGEPQTDWHTPADLLDAAETNSALHAALAARPPVQRQLLALAFFHGMSHSEIAAHAKMPLGTVKTHLRRALAALRTELCASEGGVR